MRVKLLLLCIFLFMSPLYCGWAWAATRSLTACDLALDPPSSKVSLQLIALEEANAVLPYEASAALGSPEQRQIVYLATHAYQARTFAPHRPPDRRELILTMRANSSKLMDSRPVPEARWGFPEFSYLMTYLNGGFQHNRTYSTKPEVVTRATFFPDAEHLALVKVSNPRTNDESFLLIHGWQARSRHLLALDPIDGQNKVFALMADRDDRFSLRELGVNAFTSARGRLKIEAVLQIRHREKTVSPVTELMTRVKALTTVAYARDSVLYPGASNLTKNQIVDRIRNLVAALKTAELLVESLRTAPPTDPQRHAEILELNWELRMHREVADRLNFDEWLAAKIIVAHPPNVVSLTARPLTLAQARSRLTAAQKRTIDMHVNALTAVGAIPVAEWTHAELAKITAAIFAYGDLTHQLESALSLRSNIDQALNPLYAALAATLEPNADALLNGNNLVPGLILQKDWKALQAARAFEP